MLKLISSGFCYSGRVRALAIGGTLFRRSYPDVVRVYFSPPTKVGGRKIKSLMTKSGETSLRTNSANENNFRKVNNYSKAKYIYIYM